ncbi:MFS transporter [Sulfobacillus thermosulfidooxidans]|uniref:MFS transporter n=1 Tax=Sulfobacillus thermosulfidooxidans TaxID=28034 RepID=UPI00040B4868|nr:MFS transporter [Sulfobacillus thermosulfidooxidans]
MHFSNSQSGRALWPLLIATMVIQSGFGSILPLLPLFVRQRGLPLSWIGLMAALYALISFVGQLILGPLSDRWGRKRLLVIGSFLSALGTFLFLLAVPPGYYLLFRALQGIGVAAFLPAANALVADYVEEEHRGRAYALMSSFYMAGFALGPMIGGLASATGSLRAPFWVGTVLDVGALIAVMTGIAKTPVVSRFTRRANDAQHALIPWRYLVGWLIINFGWMGLGGMYDATWSIYMQSIGANSLLISLSWTLFALPYLLFNFFAGRLADNPAKRPRLIYTGAILNGIMIILYTLSRWPWVSILLSSIEAIAMSLITPALNADVMAFATDATRGKIQGVFQSAGTLGSFVLALMSGYLLPRGATDALLAGALVLFLSIGLAFIWQGTFGRRASME